MSRSALRQQAKARLAKLHGQQMIIHFIYGTERAPRRPMITEATSSAAGKSSLPSHRLQSAHRIAGRAGIPDPTGEQPKHRQLWLCRVGGHDDQNVILTCERQLAEGSTFSVGQLPDGEMIIGQVLTIDGLAAYGEDFIWWSDHPAHRNKPFRRGLVRLGGKTLYFVVQCTAHNKPSEYRVVRLGPGDPYSEDTEDIDLPTSQPSRSFSQQLWFRDIGRQVACPPLSGVPVSVRENLVADPMVIPVEVRVRWSQASRGRTVYLFGRPKTEIVYPVMDDRGVEIGRGRGYDLIPSSSNTPGRPCRGNNPTAAGLCVAPNLTAWTILRDGKRYRLVGINAGGRGNIVDIPYNPLWSERRQPPAPHSYRAHPTGVHSTASTASKELTVPVIIWDEFLLYAAPESALGTWTNMKGGTPFQAGYINLEKGMKSGIVGGLILTPDGFFAKTSAEAAAEATGEEEVHYLIRPGLIHRKYGQASRTFEVVAATELWLLVWVEVRQGNSWTTSYYFVGINSNAISPPQSTPPNGHFDSYAPDVVWVPWTGKWAGETKGDKVALWQAPWWTGSCPDSVPPAVHDTCVSQCYKLEQELKLALLRNETTR